MENLEKATKIVCDVINGINPSLFKNTPNLREIPLLENFDSLAMVTFVISLEDSIKKEFGKSISLVSGDIDQSGSGPFKTIGTIIDYIYLHLTDS